MSQTLIKHNSPIKHNKLRTSTFNQTFQSSIIDKTQKFALDKTLIKGIKQNDPSQIIQNAQQADIGNTAALYDQQRQVGSILVDMRKKYDQTKQITSKIQQHIDKLKKQKEKLQSQKNNIQSIFKNQQNQFKNIQNQLQKLSQMCQTAQYNRQVRQQMSQTLKQDILFYKKNCFQANIKIVRNHNKVKSLSNQFQNNKKISTNCKTLIYSIQKKITEKQQQRYQKINTYYDILNKKIQNNQKRQQRSKMIETSMLQALNGKMPQEQQQKKVLLVNLALKKMLKYKMERQMEKFNQIQTAFRKIQQETSVKKADQFIDKFIKRQKNYGQFLQSISKNQQTITRLKQQKQQLQKQHHDIMYLKNEIEQIQHQKKGHSNKQINTSIDVLRQRLLKNQQLKNKTFAFVTKFLSAFDSKPIQDIRKKVSKQKPNQSLKMVLQKVNKYLDSINKQEMEKKLKQIDVQSTNLNLPSGAKTRNLRIKTLSTTRDENQFDVMQDHDISYDDLSQRNFLNHNRRQIKKSAYLRNRLKTKAS